MDICHSADMGLGLGLAGYLLERQVGDMGAWGLGSSSR